MESENIRELLRGHLEMESRDEGFSPLARITWLVTRLEDYVGRFNGALAIPGWSINDLKGSDTLRVIEVGAELLDDELRTTVVPPHVGAAWKEVVICLQKVQNSAEMSFSRRALRSVFQRSIRTGELDKRNAQELWDATRELCMAVKATC